MARNVIGLADLQSRFLQKTEPGSGGCLIWTGAARRDGTGYGATWMPKGYGGRVVGAHIGSFTLFRGEVPPGMNVCHTCDVRRCVSPRHLWLGTQADNIADMVAKGRHGLHPWSKLSEESVRAIRSAVGVTQTVLAERYGVSQSIISEVRTGKGWAHVA